MKLTSLMVGCVCLCAAAALRAEELSVAVVDMEELIRLHPNTASDRKLLDATVKDFRGENEEMLQKIEALRADFEQARKEAADATLSEKKRKEAEDRALKARDLVAMAERNRVEKMQQRQEQIGDMNSRMVRKTIAELREVIGKYADEHKLRIVLPANQVVYQVKGLDITDAILKAMNIERPAREEARPLTPAVTPAAPPSKDKEPATGAK